MFGHVRPCAKSPKWSCNVQTTYALIWLGACLGPMVKTRSISGSGAIIAQIQCHMNFNPFNFWHRLGSLLFAFFLDISLCVQTRARGGPRRFSHSFATAWHYLQRPGTRDIDVCPKNFSRGIRAPAAAGRFVMTLYQVLQPYHIKALGVLLQYAIGPMGRLSRKRPGGGTATPQGGPPGVSNHLQKSYACIG